jgi:hypothetical protein
VSTVAFEKSALYRSALMNSALLLTLLGSISFR